MTTSKFYILAIIKKYLYVAHINYKISLWRPSPYSSLYSFWLYYMYIHTHALYTHVLNHIVTNFMLYLLSYHSSYLLIYWMIYWMIYLFIILILVFDIWPTYMLSGHWKNSTIVTWLVTPVNHYSFIFIYYLNCGQRQ